MNSSEDSSANKTKIHCADGGISKSTFSATPIHQYWVHSYDDHINSVRSLLTVPVPKLRLELDREDDSLLFVRVPHECVLGVVPR